MIEVFISYPRAQRARVEPIRSNLEKLGVRVFFDLNAIDGGADFPTAIDQAVKSARIVLACWSPLAFTRPWVMQECRVGQKRGVLVPIAIERFNELDPPTHFTDTNYFDLTDFHGQESHDGWALLLRTLSRRLGRRLAVRVEAMVPAKSARTPLPGIVAHAAMAFLAGRRKVLAALVEYPLTLEALCIWREELLDGKILLRDVVHVEATWRDVAAGNGGGVFQELWSAEIDDDGEAFAPYFTTLEAEVRSHVLEQMALTTDLLKELQRKRRSPPKALVEKAVKALDELKLYDDRITSITEAMLAIHRQREQLESSLASAGAGHGVSREDVFAALAHKSPRADGSLEATAKTERWDEFVASESSKVGRLLAEYAATFDGSAGVTPAEHRRLVDAINAGQSEMRWSRRELEQYVRFLAGSY